MFHTCANDSFHLRSYDSWSSLRWPLLLERKVIPLSLSHFVHAQTKPWSPWFSAIDINVFSFVHFSRRYTKYKTFFRNPGPLRLPVFVTAWTFFVGTKGLPVGKRFYEIQAENVKKYVKVFCNKLPGVDIIKFPSLNFYREKRKKKFLFLFFWSMVENGTSYEASWAKECFDR